MQTYCAISKRVMIGFVVNSVWLRRSAGNSIPSDTQMWMRASWLTWAWKPSFSQEWIQMIMTSWHSLVIWSSSGLQSSLGQDTPRTTELKFSLMLTGGTTLLLNGSIETTTGQEEPCLLTKQSSGLIAGFRALMTLWRRPRRTMCLLCGEMTSAIWMPVWLTMQWTSASRPSSNCLKSEASLVNTDWASQPLIATSSQSLRMLSSSESNSKRSQMISGGTTMTSSSFPSGLATFRHSLTSKAQLPILVTLLKAPNSFLL